VDQLKERQDEILFAAIVTWQSQYQDEGMLYLFQEDWFAP
jgi:hypothetical protein